MALVDYGDASDSETEVMPKNMNDKISPAQKKIRIMAPQLIKDEDKNESINTPIREVKIKMKSTLLNMLPSPAQNDIPKSVITVPRQLKKPPVINTTPSSQVCKKVLPENFLFNENMEPNLVNVTNPINLTINDYIKEDTIASDILKNQQKEQIQFQKFIPRREREIYARMINPDNKITETILPNIIDVNADDVVGADKINITLTRNVTIKDDRWDPEKKSQISSLHKRKHQITFLAQQAKEKEFELQNQWAAGRTARREGRNKYGF